MIPEFEELEWMVQHAVKKYGGMGNTMIGYDDAYQLAWIAYKNCVDKYNPDKGVLFRTYYRRRLHGIMLEEFYNLRPGKKQGGNIKVCSEDSILERGESDKYNLGTVFAPYMIRHLSIKQRKVLYAYYVRGISLKKIGEIMGFSESRACQLHTGALRILSKFKEELKNV
jgi:RNA polymerase sigma factor (sigma-70 family)